MLLSFLSYEANHIIKAGLIITLHLLGNKNGLVPYEHGKHLVLVNLRFLKTLALS